MTKSAKGRKHLSQEDNDIWRKIANTAKPLTKSQQNFTNIFSQSIQTAPGLNIDQKSLNKLHSSTAPAYQPPRQQAKFPSAHLLDQNTAQKISKGKISLDGKLDLHGYNQQDAHRLLFEYIENAYYARKRTILVITGKGNMGRGVLRENLPKWLQEPAFLRLISGFGQSNAAHGGAGALYVRIRRNI